MITNKEIREKAINCAKDDLEKLTEKFGIKNVKVNIIDDKLITNDYAKTSNITYQTQFK